MEHYDAIVVGVGGVGSAALYYLAQRGAKVLGIDRFQPPHDRGSTHGHTRVIRQAYFEHPDYVPLLREAYRGWQELEARTGQQLFHQVGLLEVGPPDGVVVPGVLRAAQQHSLVVEPLTAREIETRWPGICVGDGLTGVFEPSAGYLLVEDCVRAYLNEARAVGASVLLDTEIRSWSATSSGVRVVAADGREFSAGRLVVTAGAWAARLLHDLGMHLVVRRKSLFWFDADKADYAAVNGMPAFLFELRDAVFYGFPQLDSQGVKVAEHSGGQEIDDPLAVNKNVDREEQNRVEAFLAAHLPRVAHRVNHHAACLYTMSPDEHFIVDHYPALPRVVFAAGLSGHGYKFAPVLGRALAEMALDGSTGLPIGFLALPRFSEYS
jgi:monomeric sarcosine oxidase